jgi:hypothetical protein
VGGSCGTHGTEEKCAQGFGRKEKDHLKDQGYIGSEWILGRLAGGGGVQ